MFLSVGFSKVVKEEGKRGNDREIVIARLDRAIQDGVYFLSSGSSGQAGG